MSAAACAVWLAGAIVCTADAIGQAKPELPPAPLPRSETLVKPAVDPPGTTRVEESIQHGFFGDLSRPAPPALNRVQGIRVPDVDKGPAPSQPQTAPLTKPAAEPPAHVTVPLPGSPLPPEAATGADGFGNAGAKPEKSAAPAEQPKPRSD